jgi:16S rRNA (guanine966-N2)-methyltransferase
MRINAGKFRNHNIDITNLPTTRETSDKVRQAIFNMIGQFFDGGKALDLFAGSGAMGFEAYSRGISKIVLNDINKDVILVCKKNAMKLKCIDDVTLLNMDYKNAIESLKDNKFDLIFLDPPYAMQNVDEIINLIDINNLQNDGAILSFEMEKKTSCSETIGSYNLIKDRIYGIKRVCIYRKES